MNPEDKAIRLLAKLKHSLSVARSVKDSLEEERYFSLPDDEDFYIEIAVAVENLERAIARMQEEFKTED